MHAQIDKNKPSAQWIEHLRERYPTEKEIDRILTRRLHRRSGPGYSPFWTSISSDPALVAI